MEGATAEAAAAAQGFSAADFRTALGAFATGVTVITTHGDAEAYGMTANAFSSVSLDPPLVLVCVISGTTGAETIERNKVFAVNVLGTHQEAISRYFSSRERPKGRSAFATVPHFTAVTGSPILERSAAYLDCRLDAAHESGDHVIFIGEVVAIGVDKEIPPLLFHHGGYSVLGER